MALPTLSVSVDSTGPDGDTALHLAALYGHTQCVEMLLGAGANVAVRDADGGTPLHDACAGGFEEIVGMLLAAAGPAGASEVANARDGDDETPLHMAARGGYPGIVRMLLAAGAQGGRQVSRGALSLELRGRRVRAARAAAEVRMNSTDMHKRPSMIDRGTRYGVHLTES